MVCFGGCSLASSWFAIFSASWRINSFLNLIKNCAAGFSVRTLKGTESNYGWFSPFLLVS